MPVKPLLSIGIIYKNEIRCLERCLQSLGPLRLAVPCELVMADTGSDDGSRDIAARYADILFDFPWIDDFAAARNAVMDRCSGEWFFFLDADEWLDRDVRELAAFLLQKQWTYPFAGVTIRNYKLEALSEEYSDFLGIRMARLSTGVRFVGCIHERWPPLPGESQVVMSPLHYTILHHDGYLWSISQESKAKAERNMALLKKKLAEDPEDLQTLSQCIDSARGDLSCVSYIYRAMNGVRQKWDAWERVGPVIFRSAITAAHVHKLPEYGAWIAEAEELFPDSILTRVDVMFHAFVNAWNEQDYAECVRRGEAYRRGLADYRAGRYDRNEDICAVMELSSRGWERKLLLMHAEAYLHCGDNEDAFAILRGLDGGAMDGEQTANCVVTLARLHARTQLDTAPLLTAFYRQIEDVDPEEERALERRRAFLQAASATFATAYRAEEEERQDFQRPAYTLFLPLRGKCEPGTAAAILQALSADEMEAALETVETWDALPIQALEHALTAGVRFPLADKPLYGEELDTLASRMARKDGPIKELAVQAAQGAAEKGLQDLTWARAMVLSAVQCCGWEDREDMALCRAFVQVEAAYLPRYYGQEVLENVRLLPPLHRWGWYCVQSFEALDAGDEPGHVRLLREGLKVCPDRKEMAAFLLAAFQRQQQSSRIASASPELLALAERLRSILAAYPPNDPMVEQIKSSSAYQQVAFLIEGAEDGLPQ